MINFKIILLVYSCINIGLFAANALIYPFDKAQIPIPNRSCISGFGGSPVIALYNLPISTIRKGGLGSNQAIELRFSKVNSNRPVKIMVSMTAPALGLSIFNLFEKPLIYKNVEKITFKPKKETMYAQIWCESEDPEIGNNCEPVIVDVVLERLRFGLVPQSMMAILFLIGIVSIGYLLLGLPILKKFLMPLAPLSTISSTINKKENHQSDKKE